MAINLDEINEITLTEWKKSVSKDVTFLDELVAKANEKPYKSFNVILNEISNEVDPPVVSEEALPVSLNELYAGVDWDKKKAQAADNAMKVKANKGKIPPGMTAAEWTKLTDVEKDKMLHPADYQQPANTAPIKGQIFYKYFNIETASIPQPKLGSNYLAGISAGVSSYSDLKWPSWSDDALSELKASMQLEQGVAGQKELGTQELQLKVTENAVNSTYQYAEQMAEILSKKGIK